MTRCGWALLLALTACNRERTDPRIAEVTSPLHVVVRVIDTPVPKNCAGALSEQFACLIARSAREGCVYVEQGAAAETPLLAKQGEQDRCDFILTDHRLVLSALPLHKATLYVEPGGERVVVDLVQSAHALYLHQGELAAQYPLFTGGARSTTLLRPDGTLDWSEVPPFLAVITERQLETLTEEQLDALLAKTPNAQSALTDALVNQVGSAAEGWNLAFSKLDARHRGLARDVMLREVERGSEAALQWFMKDKTQQGPDLIEAMAFSMADSTYVSGIVLPSLFALDPATAERVACEQLEAHWHESQANPVEYEGSPQPDPVLLAVLIERKAKCPWVLPLLVHDPCSWELTCDPDLEDLAETPLCTAEQAQRPLKRALYPEAEEPEAPEEDLADEAISDFGALLVTSARQQGPLPPAFTLAQARRLYPVTYTFKGDEADDPCRQLTRHPGALACQLPPAISTTRTEGCTLALDDVKQTLTLSPIVVDAGVLERPW